MASLQDVPEIQRTTSFPDCLHENSCYFTDIIFPVRRTSSNSDIYRYYRYFDLVQRNNGVLFTWKHYLEILQEQLRNFDTLLIIGKSVVDHLSLASSVQTPAYSFPQKWININEKVTMNDETNSYISVDAKIETSITDTCSETSSYSRISSRKNRYVLLKRICSELRSFTTKIHRIVERISILTKKCPSCGNPLGDSKHLKYCTDIIEDIGDTAILLQQMCSKNIDDVAVTPTDEMSTCRDINVRAAGETKNWNHAKTFDCIK